MPQSAICTGHVRHRRFRTRSHSFQYAVFMVLVDLEQIDTLFNMGWLWNTRRALVQFRRSDYLPGAASLLDEVRNTVESRLGVRPEGKVLALTNPRIFGYLINPISIFYCYQKNTEQLQAIVLEVTNTPWKESTRYVLQCDLQSHTQRIDFDKAMHVSPFLPMGLRYSLRTNAPTDRVAVHLQTLEQGELALDATLALKVRKPSSLLQSKVLLQYPWMTVKVFLGIHWQALRLFVKKVPFVAHPKQMKIENKQGT